MAVQFPNGFIMTSKEPIDSKLVLTKAQMKTAEEDLNMPDHYFCLCKDDGKMYVFNVNNLDDEELGKFRLLAGESADVPYADLTEEANVKLDELVENGVYKIAQAIDNPRGTDVAGHLVSSNLDGGNAIEQSWYSQTNYAHRVIDGSPSPEENFYVNDVVVEPVGSIVTLNCAPNGSVYKLRGSLNGQIVINDGQGGYPATKTFITLILDGVNIETSASSAILSNGEEVRVNLEINEGTSNFITSTYEGVETSYGAIHSEADMYVSGTGYLTIVTTGGHGIKGTDILVSGKPHIYIDTVHDAWHGKSLSICGGYYYVKNCVDAFSAGSSNNDGLIKVSGGNIIVEKCSENVFQAKESDTPTTGGKIRIFYDANINVMDNYGTGAICNAYSTKVWPSVTFRVPSGKSVPFIDINTEYATTPTVYDEQNRMYINATDNVFNIQTAGDTYTLKGNFTGYKVIVPNASKSLVLDGVYLNDESNDDGAFIEYTYEEKNVKILLTNADGVNLEEKVSYLKKNSGYIIKSSNNVNINDTASGTADIYMSCPNGYCIWASNEARIQNDGTRYFVNSKYGIRANLVNIADELAEEDYTKTKTAVVYCDGNTDYDIGVFHNTYKGEERDGQVNVTANCFGTAYLGKVIKLVPSESAGILAETHNVVPSGSSEFSRKPFVYASENNLECVDVTIVEESIPNDFHLDPSILSGGTGSWKVYTSSDSYTKVESDARYSLKSELEALLLRIESLEQRVAALEGGSVFPVLDNEGNLTLVNTTITDDGELSVGTRSYIDENGYLKLL